MSGKRSRSGSSRILKSEVERMPAETKQALAVTAHILPGEESPLFQIETHLSMMDDGGSWWEVPAYLSPMAIALRMWSRPPSGRRNEFSRR